MSSVWRRVLIVLLWLAVPLQGALAQGLCCGGDVGHGVVVGVGAEVEPLGATAGHSHAHADLGSVAERHAAREAQVDAHADARADAHADAHAAHAHSHAPSDAGHHPAASPAADVPAVADAGSAPHDHASTAGCAHCAACCAAAALAPPVPVALRLDVDGSPADALTVRPRGTVPTRLERPPRPSRA